MYQVDRLELMQSIATRGLELLTKYQNNPQYIPDLFKQFSNFNNDLNNVLLTFSQNPDKVWQMLFAYWKDALDLLQEQFNHWLVGSNMPISDQHFSSEEWLENPFFNMLTQQYLLAREHLTAILEQLDYQDTRLAKRVRFFINHYLDAISPDNFLYTNPQLIAETIASHGNNLLIGLRNFLNDLDAGSARLMLKMTDHDAFTLGKNIARTKGKVIFKNDLIELIQYKPVTEKAYEIPLLIIPPWINKYYILDLSPENSLINWLVQQGITTYTISWVNPRREHTEKSIYDYLKDGPISAIEVIKKQLNVKKINVLGFCIGGTLQAMLLAYFKGENNNTINSATFLATLIDFSDPGDISVFIDEEQISDLEEQMKKTGYLEGHFMASAFNSLRARDLIWSFFIKHYLRGQPHVPFDILYWNADHTNMPAKMHSQYLRWLYLHNNLIKPNKIKLNNVSLDLTKVDIPVFFVATAKDHIAPWKTVFNGFQQFKSNKKFLLGGSGHIAGIINPPNNKKYGFHYNSKSATDADIWLEGAHHYSGSWWPKWFKWLKDKSGKLVNAPDFTKTSYKKAPNAPGNYVHMKSKIEDINST